MIISRLNPFTLIDYPGHIACILFTQGCNFRCPYCQNPELVDPSRYINNNVEINKVRSFLLGRKGKLDGVVITGGEPTIHSDLPMLCEMIKDLGYVIKLDTNGYEPTMLSYLINNHLIDYVAMDYKAPLEKYPMITGKLRMDIGRISHSKSIIMSSGLRHEFRTTVVRELLSLEDLVRISSEIKGADLYAIQRFRPDKVLDDDLRYCSSYSAEEIGSIRSLILNNVKKLIIR